MTKEEYRKQLLRRNGFYFEHLDIEDYDWKYVEEHLDVSPEFIREFKNYLNISAFIDKQDFPEDFLSEIKDYPGVYWSDIIMKQRPLSENFIEKHIDELDLNLVIKYQKVSEAFIERHINELNLNLVVQHQEVSDNFIEKHINKLDFFTVIGYRNVSEAFIEKYIMPKYVDEFNKTDTFHRNNRYEIKWRTRYILQYQKLSENFIEKYIDVLSLGEILEYQKVSEAFIEKHINEFDSSDYWKIISEHQRLSEDFIEKYIDKLDLNEIIKLNKLSEAFIEKHIDKLRLDRILEYQKVSESFIENHINELRLNKVLEYQDLSEAFIEKHIDKFDLNEVIRYQKVSEAFIERHINELNLNLVVQHQEVSDNFIEKHIDKFDLYTITKLKKVSEAFIEKHINEMYFDLVLIHQKVSETFIENHIDEFNNNIHYWSIISSEQDLSEAFIEKYIDKLDLSIINFQKVSEAFIEKHIDKFDLDAVFYAKSISKDFIFNNVGEVLTKSKFSLSEIMSILKDDYTKEEILDRIRTQKPNIDKVLQKEFGINLEDIDNINWKSISSNIGLSEDFLREFIFKLDIKSVSRYQDLSENFVRDFGKYLELREIFQRQDFSEELIGDFINENLIDGYCMTYVLEYQRLSEDFIRKFQSHFDLYDISSNPRIKLSEDFIREIVDYVDLKAMSEYQIFSEDFIREFKNRVDWEKISIYQDLSEDFIIEFKDYVDWANIIEYQDLSKEFIIENISTIMTCSFFNIDFLIENQKSLQDLPKDEIKKEFLDAFKKQRPNAEKLLQDELGIKLEDIDEVSWNYISMNKTLSEDFIREFKDFLSLGKILKHQNISAEFALEITNGDYYRVVNNCNYLSKDFIINNIDMILIEGEISLDELIENQKSLQDLPKEEIKKELLDAFRKQRPNVEKLLQDELGIKIEDIGNIDWYDISKNKILSEDFIREFKDYLDLTEVFVNQDLSEDFIDEIKKDINWEQSIRENEFSKKFVFKNIDIIILNNYIPLNELIKNTKGLQDLSKNEAKKELLDAFRKKRPNAEKLLQDELGIKIEKLYSTNWEYISTKKELSEDFIREFKDFVNWFDISKHQNLSENFILEFKDYVDWKQIIKNQDLSKDFIIKNINMISEQDNVTLDLILNNQKSLQDLPKDEIKKELLDELRKQRASKEKPIKNKFISMLNKLKPDFDMNNFVNEAVDIYKNLDGDSRKEFLSELKKQRSNAIDINDKKATIDQIIKIAKQETNNDIKNNCKQNNIGHNNHDTGNR